MRVLVAAIVVFVACTPATQQSADDWMTEFPVNRGELAATGRNPYWILEPGYQLVLEGGRDRLTMTVLDDTMVVDGVETRVVEERHVEGGELVEVARNYFAISTRTNDVYYFGEDVDIYKGGAIVRHDGSWLSGVNGAKFGLMMPGTARLRLRHYQEIAPSVAMDRVEIVSLSETVRTPAGEFKDCLRVEETTPLEPHVTDYKYYARGIGLVRDGAMTLTRYGPRQ